MDTNSDIAVTSTFLFGILPIAEKVWPSVR
jgi:hypothetical protein